MNYDYNLLYNLLYKKMRSYNREHHMFDSYMTLTPISKLKMHTLNQSKLILSTLYPYNTEDTHAWANKKWQEAN